MALRSLTERVLQTLAYEAGGILVATPIYSAVFGTEPVASAVLLVWLSMAVLVWTPLHNAVFDMAEWRFCARVASDRPQSVRLLHALCLEVTNMIATLPILVLVGGLTLTEAVLADLGLTLIYTAYAYVFHLVYDRLRPVKRPGESP